MPVPRTTHRTADSLHPGRTSPCERWWQRGVCARRMGGVASSSYLNDERGSAAVDVVVVDVVVVAVLLVVFFQHQKGPHRCYPLMCEGRLERGVAQKAVGGMFIRFA